MTSWHADFSVGGWRVSPKLSNIDRDGQTVGVKRKSMAVLVCLADANGEVVSRNDIMDAVWPGMTVTDDVLTQSIVELRKAFNDDAKHPKIIETIPRVGFRLVTVVTPAGETKDAHRKTRIDLLAAAIAAIGVAIWILFAVQEDARQPVIRVEEPQSIAVLPFVNNSSDPDQEYFSDGLSEEILNLLSEIPGLKVVGRTSSFAFKGKNEDLRVIGRALGVTALLEGSVRKSGDEVRITTNLIDTSDGTQIWSETYNRTMTDIFAVQDDVAAAIIEALQIHVGTNPTRGRPTGNTEAYALYLKARVLLDSQHGKEAIDLLKQATEIDPAFAEAFELLAFGYWQQAGSSIDIAEGQRLCNEAAAKALALESELTFAQALYRLTSLESHFDRSAIEMLEQAWREQPSNSAPLRVLIFELTYRGYLHEAHRYAVQFVEQDPLSPIANYNLGESFVALGLTSEAFPPLRLSLELDNAFAKWFVPAFDLVEGRDNIAIKYYEADLKSAGITDTAWVRDLVTGARDPVTGQAYLDSHVPRILASLPDENALDWQFNFAVWYLAFGFFDRYYEEIFAAGPNDRKWSDADVQVWQGTVFRRLGFTAHPRYLKAAEMLGMFDVWEQRGPPDFCEKVGGEWMCE